MLVIIILQLGIFGLVGNFNGVAVEALNTLELGHGGDDVLKSLFAILG